MLSPEETAAFLDAIERVRQRVAFHLNGVPDAHAAVAFVAHLHRSVDEVAQRARDQGVAIACQAGCAFCCTVRVEATDAEIFHIARALGERSPDAREAMVQRLARYVAAVGETRALQDRTPCPFLEDRLCSIYDCRPAACRKAHSLSRQACEDFAADIPQNLETLLDAEALMHGTTKAYQDARLQASGHELGRAVLVALTDGTAEARWRNGASVFAGPPENQA